MDFGDIIIGSFVLIVLIFICTILWVLFSKN